MSEPTPASPADKIVLTPFKPDFRQAGRILGLAALGIGMVYALILGDLWLRGRHAYLEGEKYLSWNADPEVKKKALEAEFQAVKAKLNRLREKNRMTGDEYAERIELAVFDRDERIRESSVKYAYIWYQTAVELFSPPETKWVRLSREKMTVAKEMWKTELRAAKIPFEDYMLE